MMLASLLSKRTPFDSQELPEELLGWLIELVRRVFYLVD